jgi:hypothetical protein
MVARSFADLMQAHRAAADVARLFNLVELDYGRTKGLKWQHRDHQTIEVILIGGRAKKRQVASLDSNSEARLRAAA